MTHICVSKLTIIGSDNGLSPLSEPMLGYCWLDPREQTSVKSQSKFIHFHSRKCVWNDRLRNGGHFVSTSMFNGRHGIHEKETLQLCNCHHQTSCIRWAKFKQIEFFIWQTIRCKTNSYLTLPFHVLRFDPKTKLNNCIFAKHLLKNKWMSVQPLVIEIPKNFMWFATGSC